MGSLVLYAPDDLLFGVMEIRHFRKDGRVVCRVEDRDGRVGHEIFEKKELKLVVVSQAGLPS